MLMWVSLVDVNDVITSDTSRSLGKTFFPSCLASVVEEASLYVGRNLQFFCRSPMGPCPSESLSLGSPAILAFDSSDDSPFLPSYLTSAESKNTMNMVSSLYAPPFSPSILNTFRAEVPKYSFNRSLILRGKLSNSAWSSMHVPAQTKSSKQVRAYAMGLLGPILYRASAFYVMLIHVSTSHFLPAPLPCITYFSLVIHHCFDIWQYNQTRISLTEAARQANLCFLTALSPHPVSQQKVHGTPCGRALLLLRV